MLIIEFRFRRKITVYFFFSVFCYNTKRVCRRVYRRVCRRRDLFGGVLRRACVGRHAIAFAFAERPYTGWRVLFGTWDIYKLKARMLHLRMSDIALEETCA